MSHLKLPCHLTHLRGNLAPGPNVLFRREQDPVVGLDLVIHRLAAGQSLQSSEPGTERALLVLAGRGELSVGDRQQTLAFDRPGWIERGPSVAHVPAGCSAAVRADTDCEVALVGTDNPDPFDPRLIRPEQVPDEHRGRGILGDTAYRLVRAAFDRTSAPAPCKLVLGEVVAFPGRWSSYPPHHHVQPEIYYYRFWPEKGYGHGELGEQVFLLRQHDLLRITASLDHAQVAAPGYHMYYLWAIRHLPGDPYEGFEYNPEHADLLG